ncbi:hypothetical protein ATCC90586_009687 [Pythium insidiosum]|nr:hypothetical protein ATCC90586_009687 [Pythium insidiosum]
MARDDDGAGSYDSASGSSSSSEDNAVLLSRSLLQQQERLRERLRQQQEEEQDQRHQLNQHERQQANTPKSSVAKADQICGVCEQEGGLVVCTGPCVSAYHLSCLSSPEKSSDLQSWKCPSCAASTHVCFHCKQRGADASGASTPATPTSAGAASSSAEVLRPVVKCRALSCGKFYHQDCIAKLPLARIAGSRFICPLHTCAACEQSGAKKEPVRCTRCPVAYHTSCLPRSGVVNLPGKRIICPKHDAAAASSPPRSAAASTAASSVHDGASSGAKPVNLPSLKRIVSTDVDSVAASSPRTEDNDDEQSETSSATGATASASGSKKHGKKEKKEKKKKKKKRKKVKKKDKDKSSSTKADGDDAAAKKESDKGERNDDDDDDDDDDDGGAEEGEVDETEEKASVGVADASPKKEPSVTNDSERTVATQAVAAIVPEPVTIKAEASEKPSPLERSASASSVSTTLTKDTDSVVESPATVSQRLKARLVEVLGQSDDDLDSVASPVPSGQVAQSDAQEMPVVPPMKQESAASPIVSNESTPKGAPSFEGAEESEREAASEASDSRAYDHLSVAIPPPAAAAIDSMANDTADGETQQEADETAQRTRLESGEVDGSAETPSAQVKARAASRTAAEVAKEKLSSGRSTPGGATAAATPGGGGAHAGSKSKKKKKSKSSRSDARRGSGAGLEMSRQQSAGSVEDGEEGEEEDDDEAKWVQCDECRKWRIVPREIDLDAMPERWYCRMNTWRPEMASCSVPEEAADNKGGAGAGTASKASGAASRSRKRKPSAADAMVASQVPLVTSKKARHQQRAGKDDGSAAANADVGSLPALPHASGVSEGEKAPKRDKDSKKRKLKLKLKEKYGEVKWVQCEHVTCGKWRVVPPSIDFDLLPAVWYCHLNSWAPELASCAAPNPPEVEIYLSKSQSRKASTSRPAKRHRGDSATAAGSGGAAAGQVGPQSAGKGSAKAGKGSTPTAHLHDHDAARGHPNPGSSGGASSSAGAGVSGSNSAAAGSARVAGGQDTLSVRSSGDPIVRTAVATVLEWAQCEKCNKWRKLPAHIKSSTLPDKWYCSMNHWDPTRASCSVPQDEDQEPLDASPLPSSQNWYPMPGSRGAGGTGGSFYTSTTAGVGGFRSKRGKLSYSELLYASTGQLRKAYTSESSTLVFEYEGVTYRRDDQYNRSSMYISPLTTNKLTGEAIPSEEDEAPASSTPNETVPEDRSLSAPQPSQELVDRVAAIIMEHVELQRREYPMPEIVETVVQALSGSPGTLSLQAVTTALVQLEHRGVIERLPPRASDQQSDVDARIERLARKRKATATAMALALGTLSSSERTMFFRKVPKRPLKALKAWKTVASSALVDGVSR